MTVTAANAGNYIRCPHCHTSENQWIFSYHSAPTPREWVDGHATAGPVVSYTCLY